MKKTAVQGQMAQFKHIKPLADTGGSAPMSPADAVKKKSLTEILEEKMQKKSQDKKESESLLKGYDVITDFIALSEASVIGYAKQMHG